jgi:glutathione synthase/RimK-type ligase-like ATP-grasp enzyme
VARTGLVLFSYKSHKRRYIERLFEQLSTHAIEKHGVALERSALKELHIAVNNSSLIVYDPLTQKHLDDFAAVYFELWYKCPEQALAAALFCSRTQTPFFSRELQAIASRTKVGEISFLADNSVPLPATFSSSHTQIKKYFKRNNTSKMFGYPFVLKAADSYGGKANFLIKCRQELIDTLNSYPEITFVAQEYIPNDCDYRFLIFGGDIALVIKRARQNTATHLNNTSAGATGTLVSKDKFKPQIIRDVIKAAKILNRDSFAGVDLIIDTNTQKHYILEVNKTPQIEIGAEVEAKMDALIKYMIQLGGHRW